MGSKTRESTPASVRKLRRGLSNSKRRASKSSQVRRLSPANADGGASVSDKLEALKSLIPSNNRDIKPDQLFQETADYIVLLKTQVFVLQKLIDVYGSALPQENQNSV